MRSYHYIIVILFLVAAYYAGVFYPSPGKQAITTVQGWTGNSNA